MKLIAWNCRGLGNNPAITGLLDIQKREDPDVLFLSETRMIQDRIDWLRWKLGMPHMVVKDCCGKGGGGGLALFWKRDVDVKLTGFVSRYHIDTDIMEQDGYVWRFTGIYGEPKMELKDQTWKLLRTLKNQNNKPWLCASAFNEVLHSWEKEGGVTRSQASMDKFKMALEDCELHDLGFIGDVFTWRNHNHNPSDMFTRDLAELLRHSPGGTDSQV
ncbi:uncharacterized protein [Aegilops tauschii subsp. strangulata]|uniref:uncharacterized protein n=1 Tax=Aegilops tauschii subsp. strangulata TaxID=200361 RepID=UPI003CC89128